MTAPDHMPRAVQNRLALPGASTHEFKLIIVRRDAPEEIGKLSGERQVHAA